MDGNELIFHQSIISWFVWVYYEWTKRTKFLLAVMYGSSRRHSNDEPVDRNNLSRKVWKIGTWNFDTIFSQVFNLCYQNLWLMSLISSDGFIVKIKETLLRTPGYYIIITIYDSNFKLSITIFVLKMFRLEKNRFPGKNYFST